MMAQIKSSICELWEKNSQFAFHTFASMLLFLLVGYFFAQHLYTYKTLEFFKLLNLIGLALDGIGVLLLSNLLLRHKAVQKFISTTVYIYALGLLAFLPLGIFLGIGDGFKQHALSVGVAKPLLLLCGAVFFSDDS